MLFDDRRTKRAPQSVREALETAYQDMRAPGTFSDLAGVFEGELRKLPEHVREELGGNVIGSTHQKAEAVLERLAETNAVLVFHGRTPQGSPHWLRGDPAQRLYGVVLFLGAVPMTGPASAPDVRVLLFRQHRGAQNSFGPFWEYSELPPGLVEALRAEQPAGAASGAA